jgi:N-ethylmaleimide reductase
VTNILDPIQLGAISAPNRVFMAPCTRARSTRDFIPHTELKAQYYAQRAGSGLIIAEAVGISVEGLGWPNAPGIWNDAQIEAWKPVTEAVHNAGGRIMIQLWHMGRLVHPDYLGGAKPVSSSATQAPGRAHTYNGKQPYGEARALEIGEIGRVVEDYATAARNSRAAGFDGAQIHAANGYLIDQFLRDNCNFREDDYGGPVSNRIRLLREVTSAVASEIGADRTAVRLSPNGETQGAEDSNPVALFTAAAKAMDEIGIAFLELRELSPTGTFGATGVPRVSPDIRPVFKGPLILNQDYRMDNYQADLVSGLADGISFGRPYIANPDLVERIRNGNDWALDDMATWYSEGPEGLVDYPVASAA